MTARTWMRRGGVAVAVWLAGCATSEENYFNNTHSRANVFVSPGRGSVIAKVAVMPFKAQTELIGISVSDMFVTEILRAGKYELVERGRMAQVLSESELALSGLSASRAAEIGGMLGADGVIIGTVDEYANVAQRGHPYPVVGVTARMIDCKSGKVLWSVDLARRAESKRVTMPEHARAIVHEMMSGLYQKWGR
jgi:curli biogenesis system outer membrane secretion channel CsgG